MERITLSSSEKESLPIWEGEKNAGGNQPSWYIHQIAVSLSSCSLIFHISCGPRSSKFPAFVESSFFMESYDLSILGLEIHGYGSNLLHCNTYIFLQSVMFRIFTIIFLCVSFTLTCFLLLKSVRLALRSFCFICHTYIKAFVQLLAQKQITVCQYSSTKIKAYSVFVIMKRLHNKVCGSTV